MGDLNFFDAKRSIYLKKIKTKDELSKSGTCDGYLLDCYEKEARRITESLKKSGKIIAILGSDNAFNRRAIETLKIHYLVSPERSQKKDTLKQRDSGLNHVLAKEAARKNISIVIDVHELKGLKGEEKAKRLARIMQNITISKRAKCEIRIASFAPHEEEVADIKQRMSLGTSLGMSSQQAKNAVEFST